MANTHRSADRHGRSTPQPAQQQRHQPGRQTQMTPEPISIRDDYRGSGKLEGKVALISGGDSGIGRAVALHFAREGASVAIIYLEEDQDARQTQRLVEAEGAECLLLRGDVADPAFCADAVKQTVERLGALDILVNNAARQSPVSEPTQISAQQLEQTFRVNVFGYLFLAQAALEHMGEDGSIINTSSITAFRGNRKLVDYSATKGAIRALTYSLAQQLIERGIRVNGVAPGPVWTPLIPATFSADEVAQFGADNPMKRPAQPCHAGDPAVECVAAALAVTRVPVVAARTAGTRIRERRASPFNGLSYQYGLSSSPPTSHGVPRHRSRYCLALASR